MRILHGLAAADGVRALVTGANGFVGRYLTRELLERGYSVFGGIHGPHGASETDGDAHPGVYHRVPLDVTSLPSIRSAVEEAHPELVFHLAGQSSVRSSFAEPLATWDVNATGTLRLLHVLQQRESVRVLVVSSAEVYGVVPEAQQPIREAAPLRPANPYAASKAAAEMAAFTAERNGTSAGGGGPQLQSYRPRSGRALRAPQLRASARPSGTADTIIGAAGR